MPKRTVDLPVKVGSLGATDFLVLVDTVDTTDSPEGSDLRAPAVRVVTTDGNATQITQGGSIDLGGFAVIVAKAGTVAMLDDVNPPHTHLEAEITDLDKYTQAAVDALLAGKAEAVHIHAIDDVTGLQAALDAKKDDFPATITGAGSIELTGASLDGGGKTGVIVTEDEVSGDAVPSIVICLFNGPSIDATTSWADYSRFYWQPDMLPDGWTCKLQALLGIGSGGTIEARVTLNGVVANSTVQTNQSSPTLVTSGDIAAGMNTSGAGSIQLHEAVGTTGKLYGAWLILEPPA